MIQRKLILSEIKQHMSKIINVTDNGFENQYIFSVGDEMRSICHDFLQAKNLNHFAYVRLYNDNATFTLTTDPGVSVDYYQHKFYNTVDYHNATREHQSATLLWVALSPKDYTLTKYVRDYHNLANGFLIIKKSPEFVERFTFATTPDNVGINNLYISQLGDFYNFCFYFKEKAKKLIEKAHEDRFILHDAKFSNVSERGIHYPESRPKIIINEPAFKKLYYGSSFTQSLTRREFQCLAALSEGMQIKEISKKLSLQTRTVNFYLENIKDKIGLYSRRELIDFYNELF